MPSLPLVEARNVSASCATTARRFDTQGRAAAVKYGGVSNGIDGSSSHGGSSPDGVIDQTYSGTKTRPGTMIPLKRKMLEGFSNASANPDAIVDVDGDEDSGQGAISSSLKAPFPPPPDSSKKRRNLDWGKGANHKGAGAAVADNSSSEAVGSFNLFLPAYGKRCQGRGVNGGDKEAR